MRRPNITETATRYWMQLLQILPSHLCNKPIRHAARVLCAACGILIAASAASQTIDTVDVVRSETITEIHVRFSTQIQYVRHAPLDSGANLRIYIQVMGFNMDSSTPIPYSRQIQGNGAHPNLTVTYPDNQNSVQVNFDAATRFTVRPGDDGRSIVILLPNSKGG